MSRDIPWLASLGGPIDGAEAIADVDLSRNVLVAGIYPTCSEDSTVYLDTYGEHRLARLQITTRDENRRCLWSPKRLDVWAVPAEGEARPAAVARQVYREGPRRIEAKSTTIATARIWVIWELPRSELKNQVLFTLYRPFAH